MNKLENVVRINANNLRNILRKMNEVEHVISTHNLDKKEFESEIDYLLTEHDKIKMNLKKNLKDYFEYEKANPDIPKNFLFRKLYKTFF